MSYEFLRKDENGNWRVEDQGGKQLRRPTIEDIRHFEHMERLDEQNRLLAVIAEQLTALEMNTRATT